MQYNTVQYNTIQFNTVLYNTIQYNTTYFQHSTLANHNVASCPYSLHYTAPHYASLHHIWFAVQWCSSSISPFVLSLSFSSCLVFSPLLFCSLFQLMCSILLSFRLLRWIHFLSTALLWCRWVLTTAQTHLISSIFLPLTGRCTIAELKLHYFAIIRSITS